MKSLNLETESSLIESLGDISVRTPKLDDEKLLLAIATMKSEVGNCKKQVAETCEVKKNLKIDLNSAYEKIDGLQLNIESLINENHHTLEKLNEYVENFNELEKKHINLQVVYEESVQINADYRKKKEQLDSSIGYVNKREKDFDWMDKKIVLNNDKIDNLEDRVELLNKKNTALCSEKEKLLFLKSLNGELVTKVEDLKHKLVDIDPIQEESKNLKEAPNEDAAVKYSFYRREDYIKDEAKRRDSENVLKCQHKYEVIADEYKKEIEDFYKHESLKFSQIYNNNYPTTGKEFNKTNSAKKTKPKVQKTRK